MPLTAAEILDRYGSVVISRNAALFVGAGLSAAAGYPSWTSLLEEVRREADIPNELGDLPLLAQYYVQAMPGNRERVNAHLLATLAEVEPKPGRGHEHLARLPVAEIWTTNYDTLLEGAVIDAKVIAREEDLIERVSFSQRRVIKMHGSLSREQPTRWVAPPVITRQDYEKYEWDHPRMWAALTAAYLTKSFLFLGFSFSDPNIEVLLRLARTRLSMSRPEHYTVLRRPDDAVQRQLHHHRVRDLEHSGLAVYEIDSYDEMEPLLHRLVRRTRDPQLFVSGSVPDGASIDEICKVLGQDLAALDITLASLAGPAGMGVSYAFGRSLQAHRQYDANRVRFYFQPKDEKPPDLPERIGTVVYTEDKKEDLRRIVLEESRAALVIGGGENTRAEVEIARELGVPVVAVAMSGGAARAAWEEDKQNLRSLELGGRPVDPDDFARLADPTPLVAGAAAVRLVRQAMYVLASHESGR